MKEGCKLKILFLLSFWTGCLADAPTKFLFTAPRNLWQGSTEEYCISLHDDDDSMQTHYDVTLTSKKNESVTLIGSGRASAEGRVCHSFKVPDLEGRMTLSLITETKKVDDLFTTTQTRIDKTEVQILKSSLETFVQPDKPIYKPGETVRFRAMTINRDLKPWTGVIPIVAVKNPSDVRVMQWKNVKNMKGLVSFEMPLSKDPPLGTWKIMLIVEGKEHTKTFTVQEYVLPKFEVTVTAPSYLLPISETIEGTVCAKYTYGKPVKGKVELNVCYKDSSPYFRYYRRQEERPCASRIMDINGCEKFSVDGSELFLDSSNYSRYGNLEINATVTEEATGIALDGSVKGPQMTFQAVKLKFEDDTHGYFKDAFPYYARVVVTKPDGSPAPGELIEITASNYDAPFNLQRNFTSDKNGIVNFAVKKLPKNVTRLSFNARAPKYSTPYGGRYDHKVRMYQPTHYHYANKWFSPSNSYIHIPSVVRKQKCGSTLDIDVLYSTPPDTDYKFFVQVLSKSHVVHHTHVRHHFKIHDAINFDDIPEDLLLDPYTPPPRPTYYPYPIPYDDPELGYKPPAENISVPVMVDDEDIVCTDTYKAFPNSTIVTRGVTMVASSNTNTLQECSDECTEDEKCRGFTYHSDGSGTCSLYYTTDYTTKEQEMISFYERNCNTKKKDEDSKEDSKEEDGSKVKVRGKREAKTCDLIEVSKCTQLLAIMDPSTLCETYEGFRTCIEPHMDSCKDEAAFEQITTSMSTMESQCGKDKKNCNLITVSQCTEHMATIDPTNPSKLCESLEKFKMCIEPHKEKCKNVAAFQQMTSSMSQIESQCGKDSCNLLAASECSKMLVGVEPTNMCKHFQEYKTCLEPFEEKCRDNEAFESMQSSMNMMESTCGKDGNCNIQAAADCSKIMFGFTASSMCKQYVKYKACLEPIMEGCKDTELFKQMEEGMDLYDEQCEIAEEHTVCTSMYKPFPNTTVVSEGPVMASNTRYLGECATACNKNENCRGFTYHSDGSGTCSLYTHKDYTTKEQEMVSYYERNCYIEKNPHVVPSTHIAKVRISIPITANMGPESQLLVYYVREDDETVAATLNFKVEKCFDNKVKMRFEKDTVLPGSEVKFGLMASPGSICSVGVVDKSVNLIGGDHQLTAEKIFGRFKMPYMYHSFWQDDRNYCDKKTNYDPDMVIPGEWSYRRYVTNDVDAIEAFRKMNLVVFTDLELETRPCVVDTSPPIVYYEQEPVALPSLAGSQGGIQTVRTNNRVDTESKEQSKEPDEPKDVRSEFPETWLWDLYLIGDDGEISEMTTVPHTITEWVGNSICTNLEDGIGISSITGITAFQPFFLSLTLPYSAIRGETLPVLVSIFNYMSECMVVQVSLTDGKTSSRSSVCVCPGETRSVTKNISPYKLGKIKIRATAESVPDTNGLCKNKVLSIDGLGAHDAVERELLVEAEGIEKEYTVNSYICPDGETSKEEMVLPLPSGKALVEDSARGYINVIGDIMGPALSNLQDLLRMPYGCGEQNMASFSPNIFALQYLTNTNQLLPKIEEEAKGYMRIGYQRQLKYRHADGSYSAFGGEGSGSIWLTSFVVKCLGQSRPYINIDDKDLQKSIKWFRNKQLENGCFPKIGYTHSYYLKGGFSDRSNEASLTAFVVIAMLEAGIKPSDPSIVKAIRCLDVQDIPDTYTLSMIAYAYTLYDIQHAKRQKIMDMLMQKANKKDGMMYWSRTDKKDKKEKNKWYYTAVSAEVEMTAYALLAHITGEQENAAIKARPIVMWLTKQRNPRGGFSSTQDTVVALQALARYATLVYQGGVNITMDVTDKINGGSVASFSVDDDNTLVLQTKPIETLPTTLENKVSGAGCAMIQANVKYNVEEKPTNPAFSMKVTAYPVKTRVNHCAFRTLSICVTFTGPGGVSNMAIVDVRMVTGWIPVKNSLKELIVDKDDPKFIGIEKYEVEGSFVHIYFDKLSRRRRCFVFEVEQNIEVSSPKPAQVKVYDYYETDLSLIVNYGIKTTCGTKEELPYISEEDYNRMNNTDFITQVRVPIRPPTFVEQVRVPSVGNMPSGETVSCPVCMETVDFTSKSFRAMVCGSKKIYKVQKGRKGRKSLKVYVNLRTKRKSPILKFVRKILDSRCKCDLMDNKVGKVIVFSENDTLNVKKRTLTLNSSTKILKRTKLLEKAIWRLVRKKKC